MSWALANGWREGLQIHRKNSDGHYEPGNCEFLEPEVHKLIHNYT